VIAFWFVVPEAHHAPSIFSSFPVDFNDPVVDLFAGGFETSSYIREMSLNTNQTNEYNGLSHLSHSSSSTYISSKGSYLSLPPQKTCNPNSGFASRSGWPGRSKSSGKRSTSLKSIEFSDGGFHFLLLNDSSSRYSDQQKHFGTHILGSVPTTYGDVMHVYISPSFPC